LLPFLHIPLLVFLSLLLSLVNFILPPQPRYVKSKQENKENSKGERSQRLDYHSIDIVEASLGVAGRRSEGQRSEVDETEYPIGKEREGNTKRKYRISA
jgi:hypothetical protein